MRIAIGSRCAALARRASHALTRFRASEDGATAIEFAAVGLPFFMFSFGILVIGQNFVTTNALEHGVENAARKVRTGQAQKTNMTIGQFKSLVCTEAGSYIDCNKLNVHVQSGATWAAIQPRSCLTNGSLTATAGASGDLLQTQSGGAGSVVLVTLCYEWELAKFFPAIFPGSMGSGSALIQAATTFRTEPYQ